MTDQVLYGNKHIDKDRLMQECHKALRKCDPALYKDFYPTKKEAMEMWKDTIERESTEGLEYIKDTLYDLKEKKTAKAKARRQYLKNLRSRIRQMRREVNLKKKREDYQKEIGKVITCDDDEYWDILLEVLQRKYEQEQGETKKE